MNLHFKDIELFEKLKAATLHKAVIGSSMYGTTDSNSDVDYIYIYVPSISEKNCFYPSHHQLQYKEDGIDHNFVNIFSFLKNCIIGDSSINFEIVFDNSIKNSPLSFLYDNKEAFYNFKIMRAYLGFCNRDIRELRKQKNDTEKNKKISHVLRGLEFYKMILDKKFNPIVTDELKAKINRIKSIDNWKDRQDITEQLKVDVDICRKELNLLYNSEKFHYPTFMSVENQIIIDNNLSDLINSDIWKEKSNWVMDMNPFYIANENVEITYE